MLHPFKAYFFHTNARHHSLALAETGIDRRLHHLMVETYSLDDVGQGLTWPTPTTASASAWDAIATT